MDHKPNDFPLKCIGDFIFVDHKIEKADIVLVPGCDDLTLIIKAVEIYQKGFASKIVVSGGKNQKISDYDSEAHYFSSRALSLGVPAKDMILEVDARNTFENAQFSYNLLMQKDLKIHSALLVCRGFHSRRALLTYQKYFHQNIQLICITVPGKVEITKANWIYSEEKTRVVMGEVAKIGSYFRDERKYFTKYLT